MGASMVRGVAELVDGENFDAVGFVYPGRKTRQLNQRLKNMPDSEYIVVSAGINNVESQPLKDCKEEIRQLIDNASRKRQGRKVIMCLLPHRYDKPSLNAKIDNINRYLQSETSNHKNFYILQHDVYKSDYKKDGLHFNVVGTAKFAHEIRHTIRVIQRNTE